MKMTSKNRERKKYFFFLFILLVLLFSIYALFIPRTPPPPEAFGDLPTKDAKPYGGSSYGNLPSQPEEETNDESLDSASKSNKDKASHNGGGGGGRAKFEDLSKDAWARQFKHHIGEGSGGIDVTQTE